MQRFTKKIRSIFGISAVQSMRINAIKFKQLINKSTFFVITRYLSILLNNKHSKTRNFFWYFSSTHSFFFYLILKTYLNCHVHLSLSIDLWPTRLEVYSHPYLYISGGKCRKLLCYPTLVWFWIFSSSFFFFFNNPRYLQYHLGIVLQIQGLS